MKNISLVTASVLSAMALFTTGCGNDTTTTTTTPTSNCDSTVINEVLPSTISANTTLLASKVYGLDGKVVVASGATLTIEPGTTVAGCTGSSFLVISQGAKIDANGTQVAPITFTSQNDVKGLTANGASGEWGTLAILGKSTVNTSTGTDLYEADTSLSFGGAVPADNSGVLNYVAIKHTGYAVSVGKELNGLSLAGVGSGTTISNVAILDGADDGIEIWGGTVNIDGLFIYNASDDSLDTDLGYTGTVSRIYVEQNVTDKNNYDSAGMETGNDAATADGALLPTHPTVKDGYFKVTAGGISMKNDATMTWDNVSIERTSTYDLNATTDGIITFRNDNVNTINNSAGNMQTIVTQMSLIDHRNTIMYYSTANKDSLSNTVSADKVWNVDGNVTGIANLSTVTNAAALGSIADGNVTTIWKGNAGDTNMPARY